MQHPPTATIRWAAWYGDEDLTLAFPPGWEVVPCTPRDADDIGGAGIERALDAPLGTSLLKELATGRRTACIVVDDLTRPTPGDRLVPPVLDRLNEGGIADGDVVVVMGIANHRPMDREDLHKKLGGTVLQRCRVVNHDSARDCVGIGTTTRGTPVEINRTVLEADLRLLVGSIVPHGGTGYSGGAKLLLPGVASLASAEAFHRGPAATMAYARAECDGRLDAEEAARMVGIDAIVNAVPNSRRGIAGLFVGDLVTAHRAGVELAAEVFATETPEGVDVCVLSLYPKDAEWLQHLTALAPYHTAGRPLVREGGTVVVTLAGSEGGGYHGLFGPRGALAPSRPTRLRGRDLVFFSPGLAPPDLPPVARDKTVLHPSWEATLEWLRAKHGTAATVAVFPCATTQLGPAVR